MNGIRERWRGFTEIERRAFVAAIRAHPGAAQGTARKARDAFARAMREARARDDAMIGRLQSREAERDG